MFLKCGGSMIGYVGLRENIIFRILYDCEEDKLFFALLGHGTNLFFPMPKHYVSQFCLPQNFGLNYVSTKAQLICVMKCPTCTLFLFVRAQYAG